jgi:hypothetical protein
MLIASAATQVAFEGVTDFGVRGIGVAFQELITGHDHPWCTEAALQAVLFPETLLDWMEFAVLG